MGTVREDSAYFFGFRFFKKPRKKLHTLHTLTHKADYQVFNTLDKHTHGTHIYTQVLKEGAFYPIYTHFSAFTHIYYYI